MDTDWKADQCSLQSHRSEVWESNKDLTTTGLCFYCTLKYVASAEYDLSWGY